MKSTGMVRRIDELGRIVIPKEIRKTLTINEGESIEIFTKDDEIVLKKHSSFLNIKDVIGNLINSIETTNDIIVCDINSIIVSTSKDVLNKSINSKLGKLIDSNDVTFDYNDQLEIGKFKANNYTGVKVVVSDETVGLVLVAGSNKMTDQDKTNAKMISKFIEKNLEN